MTITSQLQRVRPTYKELAADLRPLLEARRLFRRPDALAAALSDPPSARMAICRMLQSSPSEPAAAASQRPAQVLDAVALREIAPSHGKRADIVYLHGGGLVFHDVDLFRPVLEQIGRTSERGVVAFDYPKAPEHQPHDTIEAITQALRGLVVAADRPFILAGDSIGALLALYFASTTPAACLERLVLIYPVLNLHDERRFESYERYGSGYALDADFMRWFRMLARRGLPKAFDPLQPTSAELDQLPPISIAGAECDMLVDEAAAYARVLERCGHSVSHRVHLGMPHDFLLYGRRSVWAARAVDDLIGACFV
jgi:acetyl esterase/lipase